MKKNTALLVLFVFLPIVSHAQKQQRAGLVAKVTAHSVALAITNPTEPVPSAVTNNVYRCTGAGCTNFTSLATGITASSYIDTSVVAGTVYQYTATAVCPSTGIGCGTTQQPVQGEGAQSNAVVATVPNNAVAPGAPTLAPPVVS